MSSSSDKSRMSSKDATEDAAQTHDPIAVNDTEKGGSGENADDSPSPAPSTAIGAQDGGLRAWLRVLGCFLILANTMGIQSSFGGFQIFYEQSFLSQYSSSDIAWIGTLQVFCSSAGGIVTGPLFDRGYDKIAVPIGCFLSVLAYMMLSLTQNGSYYQVFLSQGVAGGLAGTFVFAPAVALVALSFEKRRSLAVGITTAGFTLGAVIYPIVFRRLQPTIGFAWTSRVIAFIALGCFLVAYPLVYWNTPRPKTQVRQLLDLKAFKEAPYALYCFAVFFMYAGYWPPYFFMITFTARAIGTSVTLAFYIFAISNAANTIARFTATFIADKFGIIEVLTAACLSSTIIAFCWAAVSTTAGMIVWSIFWGYFSGVMSACFAAVVPSLSPSPNVVGTRLGMLNFLFGIGSLISPPIAGALITAEGEGVGNVTAYLGMQMWVAACLAVAVVLFIHPLLHLRRQRAMKAAELGDGDRK